MKTNTFITKPWFLIAALSALVCFRALPYFLYPGIHFDSDQATFGLMALHLAKLRALPIFMYGQKYMLGVQSYLAAPFFVFLGAGLETIKIPELLVNIAVSLVLYSILVKQLALRPWQAFLVALPMAIPTVALSAQWMNASGGHVEPMLYVLLLYLLRHRTFSFALLAAVSMLHREWMLAPILSLWCLIYLEGRDEPNAAKIFRLRLAVWWPLFLSLIIGVEIYAYFFSPNYLGSRTPFKFNHGLENYEQSLFWVKAHFDALLGTAPTTMATLPISFPAGRRSMAFCYLFLFLFVGMSLKPFRRQANTNLPAFYFASYLWVSILISVMFYLLKLQSHDAMLIRYLLLGAFLPSSLMIYIFALNPHFRIQASAAAIVLMIALVNLSDHILYLNALAELKPVDTNGEITKYLVDHGVKYAIAPYWRAYDITFRTQEKVIVASSELVRIPRYQGIYEEHRAVAARVGERNCSGDKLVIVAGVFICMP